MPGIDATLTASDADDVEFSSPTVIKLWGIADGWLRGKAKVPEQAFVMGGVASSTIETRADMRGRVLHGSTEYPLAYQEPEASGDGDCQSDRQTD